MSTRLVLGGAVALVVHVALLSSLRQRSIAGTGPDLEIEIVPEAASDPIATVAPEAAVRQSALATPPSRRVVQGPRDLLPARGGPVDDPAASLASRAAEGVGAAPSRDFSPVGTTADLGLGRAIMVPGSVVDAEPAPPAPAASTALRDALRQRDLELGLGPEGPVVTALTSATQASRAPLRDAVTFEATIAADGHVTALRVVDSTDEGWDDARVRALEALVGKTATLRGRDGAVVRVRVTSRIVEPPKGILDKVGAVVFLELGELARKQQRSVHVRLLSVD